MEDECDVVVFAHVSKTKSMAQLFTAAADNNLNGKNHDEAIKILAHVSPKPAVKPCEEEYADAAPANFFPAVFVPTETLSQADPCTPAGQRMLCKGLVMHNPTPVAAPLVSPLPAKRLYSEAWGASNTQVSKAVSRSARVSPSRHLLRNGTTAKKNKPAAQNRYVQSLQDTQPRKKQKLDGGRLRQIPVVKEQKPKTPALTKTLEFRFCTETRSRVHATDHVTPLPTVKVIIIVHPSLNMFELAPPFFLLLVIGTPYDSAASEEEMEVHTEKPKMRLTRPKTPELETMQRARPPRVKSANEIEEEMLAKMPKFKARPLPKKILEGPSLPMLTKSTPQIPEFKEFHLRTMERAQLHPSNGSAVSTSSTSLQQSDLLLELQERRRSVPGRTSGLMEVCPPRLHTASRARPTMVKSRDEMEAEELAKIFKSRGDLGIFRNQKREVTLPHEFHFKTDERAHIRCPAPPIEQFGKIPPKPGPKECTKPEPLHLESIVRHEEEQRRMAEVTEKHNQYKLYREEYEAARKAEEEKFIKAMRREMVPIARPMPQFPPPFVPQRYWTITVEVLNLTS
ncbi:unnamed protein product [Sphagnum troendelagicum]|uniref:TPX2 C-terminal domain-containing protein n=1 Tax=Sphagnum troendelagicum TaxID=128251 RepID=A0ABP0TS32_9BRYO